MISNNVGSAVAAACIARPVVSRLREDVKLLASCIEIMIVTGNAPTHDFGGATHMMSGLRAGLLTVIPAMIVFVPQQNAKATEAFYEGITISEARATMTVGAKGPRIRMHVDNRGASDLSIRAVRFASGEIARIVAVVDARGRTVSLASLPVAAGDEVDFDGVKLWLEATTGSEIMQAEGEVSAGLDIGRGVLPISITVNRLADERVAQSEQTRSHGPAAHPIRRAASC